MAEPVAVPTQGFQAPGIPAVPPASQQTPGFVVPPLPAPVVPPAGTEPAPAAVPANDALAAAVAALTEAMKGKTPEGKDPEPKPEGAAPQSLNALDPSTLEDPTLRSMAGAFKALGAGLDFDRVFANALDNNNAELLDIAYLKEKGGANADGLIDLAKSIVRLVEQKSEINTKAVYAKAGGEAQWAAATAAFNKGAPQAFKEAVAAMMNSGKDSAILQAAELVVQYAKTQGFVPSPAPLLNLGAPAAVGQGLGKAEFQAELRKLDPQDRDYATKRETLFVRRQLGKQVGQ